MDESDFKAVFEADCQHIRTCDMVIVNAENQLGVGTSQEMLIAKYFKKPVITILPKDTYHRRSNIQINSKFISDWIHPFIFSTSDFILEDIQEINTIKNKVLNTKIKDISILE